jgi:single-strand DNA-binding protein
MSDINKTILIGRLTANPELRHTPAGTAITDFNLAVNRTWSQGGEKKEEVSFIKCTAWSKPAEAICQYVKKGHRFGVTGYLKQNRWEDKDGNNRSSLEVVVESFQFLQPKSESERAESQQEYEKNNSPAGVEEKPFSDDDIPF